jgi:acyl-CoA thioester hydrolase
MPRPDPALLRPARYRFSHPITTRFADVDPNRHLNNVALAAMMEDARVRFVQAVGIEAKPGERRVMVASFAIEYLAQGYFPAPVTVHCAIEGIGRTSWTVAQLLIQDGQAVAFARSIIVAIADDRPATLADDFRARLGEWSLTS